MPHFTYRAYDQRGKLIDGAMEAASRENVLASLHTRGFFPLDVAEVARLTVARWWERDIFGGGEMPAARLMLFTREIATLVKADLPVDEALRIVVVQPMLPAKVRLAASEIHEAVRGGASLAQALAARGGEFPEFYWRLIQAGEASGSLSETLDDLAAFLERAGETRAKLASALVYPAVLFIAACVAVAIVMTVLLPTIVPLFKESGASPPAALQFMLDCQDFVSSYFAAILIGAVAFASAIAALLRNEHTRDRLDRNILRLPIVGRLVTARETARFARTFATLSRNGVPILDSLRLTSSVMRNSAFRRAVDDAGVRVKAGDRLATPLVQSGLFPELVLRLVTVGEQTGQLEGMLTRVAVIFEQSMQRQTTQLLTLLAPALTLFIGVTIGGLILAVMNAILSVNELASP